MFAGTRLVIKALRDISPARKVTGRAPDDDEPRLLVADASRLMRDRTLFDPYDSFANARCARTKHANERFDTPVECRLRRATPSTSI